MLIQRRDVCQAGARQFAVRSDPAQRLHHLRHDAHRHPGQTRQESTTQLEKHHTTIGARARRSQRRLHRAVRSRHRFDRLQCRYRPDTATVVESCGSPSLRVAWCLRTIRAYVIGAVCWPKARQNTTPHPDDLKAIKPRLAELLKSVKLFDSDSPKSALIAGGAVHGVARRSLAAGDPSWIARSRE